MTRKGEWSSFVISVGKYSFLSDNVSVRCQSLTDVIKKFVWVDDSNFE